MTYEKTIHQKDKKGQSSIGLFYICGLLAAIILLIDLNIPLGVAGGVPYIVIILLSLKSSKNSFTIIAAGLCSLLTIVGFYASPEGGEMWKVVSNRLLALFAIWVTASLALIQRTKDLKIIEEHLKTLQTENELKVQKKRLEILRATMRTVHDIVGNFLNNLQLFRMEAEEKNALSAESTELMGSIIRDTSERLTKLGNLNNIQEKKMAGGNIGIDYE